MSASRPVGSPERIQEGCRAGEKGLGFVLGRQLVGSGKDLQMVQTNHGRIPCSSWLWGLTLQTQTEAWRSKIHIYGETVEGTRQQGPTSCTRSRNGEWRWWRGNRSRVWTPVFPLLGSLGSCAFQGWQSTTAAIGRYAEKRGLLQMSFCLPRATPKKETY